MLYNRTMRAIRRRLKLKQAEMGLAHKQAYGRYETAKFFPTPKTFAVIRQVLIDRGATEEEIERLDRRYVEDLEREARRRAREEEKKILDQADGGEPDQGSVQE